MPSPAADSQTRLDAARVVLRETFGYPDLRPGQAEVLDAVLEGRDVLAVMPTGAGKSMCYQLPALVREGLTVVVSPLIALMRDQVAQLRNNGVAAGALNSSNDQAENDRVRDALREGALRLLYVSPERLVNNGTAEWLARAGVRLLAIDEAHCVSQWGHDFRPEYAQLGEVRRRLGDVQTIALTATADVATRADIASRLFEREPTVFVHGFDRPNLFLAMEPRANRARQIRGFLDKHKGESGIVYCLSRKATEDIAENLREHGVDAIAYHAGLASEERSRRQDRFLQEDGIVMVATVAFGMGIDKPDVRFVAHASLPKSIEAYYQEIGRAGRDGESADTLTLYGIDDIRVRRLQIEESAVSDDQKRIERQRLDALVSLCEAPRCRRQTLLSYFGEKSEPCGRCDLCAGGVKTFDGTVEAQKILSAIARTGERFGAEHIVAILTGEETDQVRRHGHAGLRTFGVGKDRPKQEWRSLMRQIYAAGLVQIALDDHGRWRITERGDAALRGLEKVTLRSDVLDKASSRKERRASAIEEAGLSPDDPLLKRLKALRLTIAKDEEVPAYVVFTDRSLVDMALLRPRSLDQLAACHGVGQAKLSRYGEAFLEALLEA
ncbi:MAG: DNA helicase RecQ [Microvirga sp.]|nr:DNA helicase RecQ [Microvirga sp.]